MNEPFPIVPPPELVRQWTQYNGDDDAERFWTRIATQAAQWGADTELNYCCDELSFWGSKGMAERLRSDRRPKPPSLAEQGMEALRSTAFERQCHYDAMFAALERLAELEVQ
jgi:hypothetical protein